MSTRGIQTLLVSTLHLFIANVLRKKYWVLTNEPGNHLGPGDNFSFDVSICDKTMLTADLFDEHYLQLVPRVVVEVGTSFEVTEELTQFDYISRKTQKLLDRGTERIIWFFTATQKVMVCERNSPDWSVSAWEKDIEVDLESGIPYVDRSGRSG